MGWVVLIYLIGMIFSVGVFRVRAGLPFWSVLSLGFVFQNFSWFLVGMGKMLVWPVVLLVWLATGSKPSPWRVNQGKIIRVEAAGQPAVPPAQ